MAISNSPIKPGTRSLSAKRTLAAERRRVERLSLTLAAELIELPAGARIAGRMSDCCLFGCFVDTINTFPDGTRIRLRLRKGNEMFEAEGVVAYSQLRLGMGIAFTLISQENRQVLESWMARGIDQQIHGIAPMSSEPEFRTATSKSDQFEKLVHLLVVKGILKDAEVRELLGNTLV
jgi:hypothetical protein